MGISASNFTNVWAGLREFFSYSHNIENIFLRAPVNGCFHAWLINFYRLKTVSILLLSIYYSNDWIDKSGYVENSTSFPTVGHVSICKLNRMYFFKRQCMYECILNVFFVNRVIWRRIIISAIYGNVFSLFTLVLRIILVDFYIKC